MYFGNSKKYSKYLPGCKAGNARFELALEFLRRNWIYSKRRRTFPVKETLSASAGYLQMKKSGTAERQPFRLWKQKTERLFYSTGKSFGQYDQIKSLPGKE